MELAELVPVRKLEASQQLMLTTESFGALRELAERVPTAGEQRLWAQPDEALRESTGQQALLPRETACPRNREPVR